MSTIKKIYKILVVEDDEYIRESMRELLEMEGFIVESAVNGHEGLEKLRASESLPDLILLDLAMPIMDGFQFRKEQTLDVKIASAPVIVMTADGRINSNRQSISAKDYIKKPFDIDELIKTVRKNLAL